MAHIWWIVGCTDDVVFLRFQELDVDFGSAEIFQDPLKLRASFVILSSGSYSLGSTTGFNRNFGFFYVSKREVSVFTALWFQCTYLLRTYTKWVCLVTCRITNDYVTKYYVPKKDKIISCVENQGTNFRTHIDM